MTSQKAGTASPYTNRMDLTYSYNATSSGQFGAGTTSGNPGQLLSLSGTLNQTTESASYTYDNVGRLVTSSQTSNSTSAQRRFDYDRWGNRTNVYDATSGGNPLQTISLDSTNSVPSNRLQIARSQAFNVASASNGATASASSTYSTSATPASGAIDGDHKGSNWGSGGGWMDNTASSYPDWLQVNFTASKTINEVDVFSIQDNYSSPSEPTQQMTFSSYGLSAFQVQYWDGSAWQTVSGGSISGNNKVWRKVSFANVTTDRIRIYVTGAADGISRLAEVEAYGYGYDANGNVINDGMHTYQYDSENRLVSVDAGATASYGYDQQNRRYKKTVGSAVTHYVWQGGQVLSEHNGGTGAVQVDYITGGGRMLAKVGGSTGNYFLSDRLSVRLALDGSGNVVGRQAHLPFGEDFAESGTQQKQHFTSYERDSEAGTDYAVNRQYNQSIGRFNRIDPYTGSNNISTPQSLNRFSYVQNDPINKSDPKGLDKCSVQLPDGSIYIYDCPHDPNDDNLKPEVFLHSASFMDSLFECWDCGNIYIDNPFVLIGGPYDRGGAYNGRKDLGEALKELDKCWNDALEKENKRNEAARERFFDKLKELGINIPEELSAVIAAELTIGIVAAVKTGGVTLAALGATIQATLIGYALALGIRGLYAATKLGWAVAQSTIDMINESSNCVTLFINDTGVTPDEARKIIGRH